MTFFTWLLCLFVLDNSERQYSEISFDIDMASRVVFTHEDLLIRLKFKNNSQKEMLFPKDLVHEYKKGNLLSKRGDIIWEVEKITKSENIAVGFEGLINRVPNMIPEAQKYDTLSYNEEFVDTFSLDLYYKFNRGRYRVRAKFNVPQNIRHHTKFLYSKWLIFNVENELGYP